MSHAPNSAPASGIEARASDWVIERRASDNWTSADQAELDAWLDQSMAHRIAYWRMNHAWSHTNRLAALRGAAPEATQNSPHASGAMLPTLFKIAAALVVVAGLSAGATVLLSHPHDRTFSTSIGGREVVSFADGSRIELNTDTVLRARMTTDQRIVWLEKGEAYFRIKHDSTHPFIVMAEGHRVTDLGTEFLVRRGAENLQVAVMQGRVTFDAPDAHTQSQIALLTPGEVATADIATNRMRVTRMPVQDLTNEMAWRHGVLVFNHTTLADAAVEFNRYNSRKLVIGDPAVASLQIGGTFQANNIEAFTDVAEHILQLHVAYRGNDIVITR
jgi:transmembrane sensor